MARRKSSRKAVRKTEGLLLPNLSRYFLLFMVALSLFFFVWVISPFFTVLVFAALVAIIFQPIHQWFLKVLSKNATISAFFSTLVVLLIFLVPLSLFVVFLVQESISSLGVLELKLLALGASPVDLTRLENLPLLGDVIQNIAERYNIEGALDKINDAFRVGLRDAIQNVGTFLISESVSLVQKVGLAIFSVFVLVITIFFLFRDGQFFRDYLKMLSPLPMKYEDEIEKKLKETTYGLVVGSFGTAILQGLLAGIGFAIAGIEHAIFYGAVMAFASLIPVVGCSIIWGPAAIGLLLSGDTTWGLFLAAWGILIISYVDNVTKPFLIGSSTKMHPLAVFFVVIGGLFVFGLKGIIFGPLILSIALTIFHIYRLEYREALDH